MLTLSGVLKDILLVALSVIIWSTPLTALQMFGYTIALGGLIYYKVDRTTVDAAYSKLLGDKNSTFDQLRLQLRPQFRRTKLKHVVGGVCIAIAIIVVLLRYTVVKPGA